MNIDDSFEIVKEILSKTYSIPAHELKGVDKLKTRWKRNKKWMLPFFNEDGRLEIEVDIKEEPILKEDFEQILDLIYLMGKKLCEKDKFHGMNFMDICKSIINIIKIFTPEEIYLNRILTTDVYYPDSDKLVPKDTKISKYLSMFSPEVYGYRYHFPYSKEDYMDFVNTVFSLLVSSLNTRATVVLSINPIDFLLVSSHTTGWKSCHAFDSGGSRTGGIAYMCDKESAVAYAYSSKKIIDGTSVLWPVKKWRQMVYLNKDSLSAIHNRQYPHDNYTYEKFARKLSAKILSLYGNTEYKWFVRGKNKSLNHEEFDRGSCKIVKMRSNFSYTDYSTSFIWMKGGNKYADIKAGVTTLPCLKCGVSRKIGKHKLFCDMCY